MGGGGGGGVGGGGGGGLSEKFSMQFTDSKSQQQSPFVAFLATTLLVIPRTFGAGYFKTFKEILKYSEKNSASRLVASLMLI